MPSGHDKGSVRRSQIITTYGVGSVVALGDESFMVTGIDRWIEDRAFRIQEPRLERQLGVQYFQLPPADDENTSHTFVPVVRFPMIYYCPTCKRLDRHGYFSAPSKNQCNACKTPLVPSRFVVVCEHGHIDDFPYFEWVHKGTTPMDGQKHALEISVSGASAALSDIVIKCSCGKSSTMYGAFARDALKGVKRCSGRRPWLSDNEECTLIPRTLQRGASNVYFSVVRSALSIPPWSEGVYKVINSYWTVFQSIPDVALQATINGMGIAKGTPYSVDDLVAAVRQRRDGTESLTADGYDETKLRTQEYEALVRGRKDGGGKDDFVCVSADGSSDLIDEWFDQVMAVQRLREVRALQSFTRLMPPESSDPPERRAQLSKEAVAWLPAIEVQGEGVFLTLKNDLLQQWEQRPDVTRRAGLIETRYRERCARFGTTPNRAITPRFLLIHTLAHILINQWALSAGYPAAAIRERIYVSDDMAGLLLYTATSDSAGSLGGIIAQAEKSRLEQLLFEAVNTFAWCSSDPLCIEADASGAESLNLAACHACVLLPEVSCEEGNSFLDRALIVGIPDNPALGFFSSLLGA